MPRYGEARRVRRYYLLVSQQVYELGEPNLISLNLGQQQSEPGVLFPTGFPGLTALNAANYFCFEDIDGTCPLEELECIGVSRDDAAAIVALLPTYGYGLEWDITFDGKALPLKPISTVTTVSSAMTPV